jgi:acetylornithine deacetylase/succinyl-diaminopimelate desuccinylase-like protein
LPSRFNWTGREKHTIIAGEKKVDWLVRFEETARQVQNLLVRGVNSLSGKLSAFRQGRLARRGPAFPLADRLLADTLRLAEIPSPSPGEAERASFIRERFNALGIIPRADEEGNIYVFLHSPRSIESPPLLLFAALGSERWHPLESLSRLDAAYAQGAGLRDVLGAAALLSVAEGVSSERLKIERDIVLFFAARSFDNPDGKFLSSLEGLFNRPFAAIGILGFTLGSLIVHAQGSYRAELVISGEGGEKEGEGADRGKASNGVVNALISAAQNLSRLWAADEVTGCYIRGIHADTVFGRTPAEGVLELELESSDGPLLDAAMDTVRTIADGTVRSPEFAGLKAAVSVSSFIPVGDPSIDAALLRVLLDVMKDLRIRAVEENGADPSAFLSSRGIPAVSLGIARGREGLVRDTIEIDSIEKGRQLVENLIREVCRQLG